ncbi:unnamed protein product, partial [Hapterophycus canaliculatus]
ERKTHKKEGLLRLNAPFESSTSSTKKAASHSRSRTANANKQVGAKNASGSAKQGASSMAPRSSAVLTLLGSLLLASGATADVHRVKLVKRSNDEFIESKLDRAEPGAEHHHPHRPHVAHEEHDHHDHHDHDQGELDVRRQHEGIITSNNAAFLRGALNLEHVLGLEKQLEKPGEGKIIVKDYQNAQYYGQV